MGDVNLRSLIFHVCFLLAMVRSYQKKKPLKYSRMDLLEAIRVVKEKKMKVSIAATKFGVPQLTLYDHISEKVRIGTGAPTILTSAEEKKIIASLQVLQEIGFGLTKELAGIVIRDYLHDWPLRPNKQVIKISPIHR